MPFSRDIFSLTTQSSLALAASLICLGLVPLANAQEGVAAAKAPQPAASSDSPFAEPNQALGMVLKRVDDLLWYQKMGDIADMDKIEYTSLPPAHPLHPKWPGETNPLLIHAYTFIPKDLDRSRKQPLIVFVHQGVHASLDTTIDAHLVRELVEQGYTVVATDYRGSTGYGKALYEDIDYGGRETDDVYLGMKWMLQRYSFLDAKRVGIVGWSHGGMITLMNIFAHPKDYAVAYAGVPVSDLIARMGYEPDSYRALYSAQYHLGETAHDDIEEYRKRSPVTHAGELDTPLLIHTNTNDEDVNYLEVEHLIQALKADGKTFEYKVYQNAPGGHYFNRTDTPLAVESRKEIYRFLARYLHPSHPQQ
ncbi:MAG TPA: alpha/beta fold hydrolase [Acidobacteriaceae bacterium]|nr:alpha/beta fold hydrolase [Acidobacteriaceae bacterium]